MKTFVIKYTLAILIVGLLALLIRGELFSSSLIIIAFQAIAIITTISARISFGKQQLNIAGYPGSGALIKHGPYRLIRHPMYAAALLLLWASIFGHLSITGFLIGVVVTAFIMYRIFLEEELLRQKYPDYSEYAKSTRRIIPFIY